MRQFFRRLGRLIIRLSDLGKSSTALDLTGDRSLEWSWVAANLPDSPGAVIDFGSGEALLSLREKV